MCGLFRENKLFWGISRNAVLGLAMDKWFFNKYIFMVFVSPKMPTVLNRGSMYDVGED